MVCNRVGNRSPTQESITSSPICAVKIAPSQVVELQDALLSQEAQFNQELSTRERMCAAYATEVEQLKGQLDDAQSIASEVGIGTSKWIALEEHSSVPLQEYVRNICNPLFPF